MASLRNLPLATKFISLSLLVSLLVWSVVDYFQTQKIRTIFNRHLDASLHISAQEDRALFDEYLRSFGKSIRLLVTKQSLKTHLLSPQWRTPAPGITVHRTIPAWLPSKAVLRAMPLVRYFLLLDQAGDVRELFTDQPKTIPRELREPRPLFQELSHNQTLLTQLDGQPFVVTSGSILDDEQRVMGHLLFASPLDSDFIYASLQGMNRQSLIALVDNYEKKVLASSRPKAIATGSSEDALSRDYLIIGKSFFDYGSSDLEAHFISLLPKATYESLGKEVLDADRLNRAVIAASILVCLCGILLLVTRRVGRVTAVIDAFAEQELRSTPDRHHSGDELALLEERFRALAAEVVNVKSTLEERVVQRTGELQAVNHRLQEEIDERLKTEEVLRQTAMLQRAILDSANYSIISTTADGTIRTFNAGAERLLGYSADEVIGRETPSLFHDRAQVAQRAEVLSQELGRVINPGFEVFVAKASAGGPDENEWTYIRKNGETLPVRLSVTAIRDKKGEISGFLGVGFDIREIKAAEQTLKDSLAEKETLLKEIHHRVKNNMQVIASLMFLQAQNAESPETLQALQESQDRVKSMGLIHEQLYRSGNLARVSFQEYMEDLVHTLGQAHGDLADRVSFQINAKDVELPVDTAIPCGLIVNELITNSLKHAFRGQQSGLVSILFVRTADIYTLTVCDNGCGLPADHDAAARKTLGLSLVTTLARQLDAELEFANDNGFSCRLLFRRV